MAATKKTGGLAGVTAGQTHICTVGKAEKVVEIVQETLCIFGVEQIQGTLHAQDHCGSVFRASIIVNLPSFSHHLG